MRALIGLIAAAPLYAFSLTCGAGSCSAADVTYQMGNLWLPYAALAACGVPVYVLLQRFKRTAAAIYMLAGWCVGTAIWLLVRLIEAGRTGHVLSAFALDPRFAGFELRSFLANGAAGVLAALVFWIIARPDIRTIRL